MKNLDSLNLVATPLLSILSCTLALAGCTRDDSLGNNTRQDASPDLEVVTRDSGPTPDVSPTDAWSCNAPPRVDDAGARQWSWSLEWPSSKPLASVCASYGVGAKLVLEVDFPADPHASSPLPDCTTDEVRNGTSRACVIAGAYRFEVDCTAGELYFELPSENTIHAWYHIEGTLVAKINRHIVGQGVECPRSIFVVAIGAAPTTDAGLLPRDAGDGDAGASPFDALAAEAAIPTDAAAPTSCTILATLKSLRLDGGVPFPESALPSTHRFSLLVDWARGAAVTGSGGTSNKANLVRDSGEWTTQGPLVLATAIAANWPKDGTTSMGRPYVSYEQITLHPTADGCAGHATGKYLGVQSDTLFDIPFEAELAGGIDGTGPEISVVPASTKAIHPLDLEAVAAGELLPPGTSARWLSNQGDMVPMTSLPREGALGISGFLVGDRALAFASSYRLEVLPAAMDLAGNLTAQLPTLATLTGPGFFAQDGFEGPVDALLGGAVKVVDATSLPIPAGKKAIRFAPNSFGTTTDTSCEDRFTARLAVPATAKSVKASVLSYRSALSTPFFGWLRLAVPNGAVSDFGMYGMTSKTTPLPNPWSGTLPGAEVNTYGELTQVELPLPAGTSGEVIFDLYRGCPEAMLPGDGLIIDDLRVE